MKDMDDDNMQIIDEKDLGLQKFEWNANYWSHCLESILKFCAVINQTHGDETSAEFISTFILTFFQLMKRQKLLRSIENGYIGQAVDLLAMVCRIEKTISSKEQK